MLLTDEGKRVLKAALVGSGHFPSAPWLPLVQPLRRPLCCGLRVRTVEPALPLAHHGHRGLSQHPHL